MLLIRRAVVTLAIAGLAVLPAVIAPRLSAHRPTLSPVSSGHQTPSRSDPFAALPFAGLAGIVVKDVGTIAAKYKTRAAAAQGDYTTGVTAGAQSWEAATLASEDRYKQGVLDASTRGAFGKGVRGASAKYQKNATTLGPSRYASGVANAQDAYAAGMQPVLAAISGIALPARGIKGTNQERANIVATRLHALRKGATA